MVVDREFTYTGSAGPGPGGRTSGRADGGRMDGRASILSNFERQYNDAHRFSQKKLNHDCAFGVLKSPESASTHFCTKNEKLVRLAHFARLAGFARGNGILDAAGDLENSRTGARLT